MIYWYPRLLRVKSGFGLIKCELLRGHQFLIHDISRTMQHFTILKISRTFMDIISDSSSSTPVKQSLNDLIDVVGFDADLALTPNIKNEFTFGSNWDRSVRLKVNNK